MLDRRTLLLGTAASLAGCDAPAQPPARAPRPRLAETSAAQKLIAAARGQVGVTRHYDSAYTVLPFPGGDVPRERGVCTDVVIRAYRDAFGIDLQALVNTDMRAAFAAYPRKWGLTRPDPSIDHRRVPNLAGRGTATRSGVVEGPRPPPAESHPESGPPPPFAHANGPPPRSGDELEEFPFPSFRANRSGCQPSSSSCSAAPSAPRRAS